MKAYALCLVIAALAGCTSGGERAEPRSSALVLTDAEPSLVEARFGRRLLAAPWPQLPEGTDALPPRDFWIERNGTRTPGPEPVLDGWLTGSGAVWVTTDERLLDARGQLLAESVAPDVNVSADGERVAFSAFDPDGTGNSVYVLSISAPSPRLVSAALEDAIMPFWLADGTLVVTGAMPGDLVGLYRLDPATGEIRQLTNQGLRIGQTGDPRFVPPPLSSRVMREEDGELVYEDGDGLRRLRLDGQDGAW